ncbi:hypothetical protein QTP88_022613 [Uroleucon formosanum]
MSRRRRLVNAKRVSRYEDEDGDGILIIIGLLIKLISYATYIFFGVLRSKRMPMKNRLSSGRRRKPERHFFRVKARFAVSWFPLMEYDSAAAYISESMAQK